MGSGLEDVANGKRLFGERRWLKGRPFANQR